MTKKEREELLALIKQGSIEALSSDEARDLIKQGSIEALKSREAKEVLKEGALEALKTKEAKELLGEYFVESFNEVVKPALEDMYDDLNIVKQEAVKRDKAIKDMQEVVSKGGFA